MTASAEISGLVLLAAAGAMAFAVLRIPVGERSRPSDGDLLEVAFGGARKAFASAMVEKADVYFHGGVEAEPEETGEHSQEHCHGDGETAHDAAAAHARARRSKSFLMGPYRWIGSRVHSQEHRHLAGVDSKELLPWLWAAVRADRGNVGAYSEAAYVAAGMMKDFNLALKILEEGIAENPKSVQLEYDRGHIFYHRLHDENTAEKVFARVLEKSEGSEDEATVRMRIDAMVYLAKGAEKKGDRVSVARYASEATRLAPDYASTKVLVEMASTGQSR